MNDPPKKESPKGGANDFKMNLEAMLARGRPTAATRKPAASMVAGAERPEKIKMTLFDEDATEEEKMSNLSQSRVSDIMDQPRVAAQRRNTTKYNADNFDFDD